VEWSQTKARCDRWMEEVALLTEEMQRNLAYCVYEHKQWMDLLNGGGHMAASTPLKAPAGPSNAVLEEGCRSYCVERAQDKVLRAQKLTAKWRPIYTEWKKNPVVRPLLVDPAFDSVAASLTSAGTASTRTTKATDTQTLLMEVTEGLAMATLKCEDEPGYVAVCFAVHSCLTAVQLDVIQSMMYNNVLLNPIPPTRRPALMLSTHADAVLSRSVLSRSHSSRAIALGVCTGVLVCQRCPAAHVLSVSVCQAPANVLIVSITLLICFCEHIAPSRARRAFKHVRLRPVCSLK
jgi:hypothetical protein